MDPYRPRLTETLGVTARAGRKLKLIGISATDELPSHSEVEAAVTVTVPQLPADAIGFVIVHKGEEALWVIGAWWQADILYHRLFRADLGTTALRPVPPEGPTACVWELLAIDQERQAWVTHVLSDPAAPDYAAYLASGTGVISTRLS